jgi:hypothetical protein
MVKFCPHDLFVNTRADLGQCPKVHDDEVKALYEKSNSYKKQRYEEEFIHFCQCMLNEVERKIVKGKQRLALIGKADAVSTNADYRLNIPYPKTSKIRNFLRADMKKMLDRCRYL